MSSIPCEFDCIHQKDGSCCLEIADYISCENDVCPHYIKKNKPAVFDCKHEGNV